MAYQPRIPTKFTSADGSTYSFTFPTGDYEWESDAGLIVPTAQMPGAHFEYDLLEEREAPMRNPRESVRFAFRETTPTAVDTAVDAAFAGLHLGKRGKLWTIDNAGDERWAVARPQGLMPLRWVAGDIFRIGASVDFARYSTWYHEALTTVGPENITASGQTWVVTNPGNAAVYNAVILVTGTYEDFSIQNDTTGYAVGATVTGNSANDWTRFDAGARTAQFDDGGAGATYEDISPTTLAGQVHLMVIAPGANTFRLTCPGTPNANVTITFYPARY